MALRYWASVTAAACLAVLPGTAWAADNPPHPKGNDTGCCFSFDNSPVNLVFCTVPGACTFRGRP